MTNKEVIMILESIQPSCGGKYSYNESEIYEAIDMAIKALEAEQMPSSQPEEDCNTCKHGYFGSACCNNCMVRFPNHYERRTDGSD